MFWKKKNPKINIHAMLPGAKKPQTMTFEQIVAAVEKIFPDAFVVDNLETGQVEIYTGLYATDEFSRAEFSTEE